MVDHPVCASLSFELFFQLKVMWKQQFFSIFNIFSLISLIWSIFSIILHLLEADTRSITEQQQSYKHFLPLLDQFKCYLSRATPYQRQLIEFDHAWALLWRYLWSTSVNICLYMCINIWFC